MVCGSFLLSCANIWNGNLSETQVIAQFKKRDYSLDAGTNYETIECCWKKTTTFS